MGFVKLKYPSNLATKEWAIDSDEIAAKLLEDSTAYAPLQKTTLTLTAAQINALDATPIELIAEQGAGKVIVPHLVCGFLEYGTTAFVVTNGDELELVYSGETTPIAKLPETFLEATDDAYAVGTAATADGILALANTAIDVRVPNGIATGDSTITLHLYYTVVDFN